MISPAHHQEVVLDLPAPPRIKLGRAPAQTEPLSLEAELQATRSLRERCERLLGELGCPVDHQTGSGA